MAKRHNGTVYMATYYVGFPNNIVKTCATICDFRKNKFKIDQVIDLFDFPPPLDYRAAVVKIAQDNNYALIISETPVQGFLRSNDNPEVIVSFLSYDNYLKQKIHKKGVPKSDVWGKKYF